MNKILGLILLTFVLIGCSSANKKSDPKPVATAPAATQNKTESTNSAASSDETAYTCQREDTRKVKIEKLNPKGCNVLYSHYYGMKKPIASSKHNLSHCEEVFQRIRKNLEGSGFKCFQFSFACGFKEMVLLMSASVGLSRFTLEEILK